MHHDDNDGSTTVAIKVVMIISVLLIAMDILEIYVSLGNLQMAATRFDAEVFEQCIKYHIISQMVFTLFALLAGISAFFLSFFLLFDNSIFMTKLYKTFIHWNHLVFGPYLLTASILGFTYFYEISFNCDPKDLSRKYLNVSTVMSLIICFLISALISVVFAFCYAIRKILLSIRFKRGGWKCLGRYFWNYVRNQPREDPPANQNQNNNNGNNNLGEENIRVQYVEMHNRQAQNNEGRALHQDPEIDEIVHRRIIQYEENDPEARRLGLNQRNLRRFDDTGSFDEEGFVDQARSSNSRSDR